MKRLQTYRAETEVLHKVTRDTEVIEAMKYLKLRGQTWTVRYPVPTDARAIFGMDEVNRSLKTKSLSEAKTKKYAVITEIQNEINDAVRAHARGPQSVAWLKHGMMVELEAYHDGIIGHDTLQLHQELLMEQHLKAAGVSEAPHPDEARETGFEHTPMEQKRLREALSAVAKSAPGARLLSTEMESYLEGLSPEYPEKTIKGKRTTLQKLVDYTDDAIISDITKPVMSNFLDEVLNTNGRSRKTVEKKLSEVTAFYNMYLLPRGKADSNPAEGLIRTVPISNRGGGEPPRRPWKVDEMIGFTEKLVELPQYRDILVGALVFAYTGCRRCEWVSAQTSQFTGAEGDEPWKLKIIEGKSASSVRSVPVHRIIRPMMQWLADGSKDGYLLDTKRSASDVEDAYGKRASRIKNKLGYVDPKIVLHSFRHNITTALEALRTPLELAKQITGHKRTDITYGRYSSGANLDWDLLTEVVDSVTYGGYDSVAEKAVATIIG